MIRVIRRAVISAVEKGDKKSSLTLWLHQYRGLFVVKCVKCCWDFVLVWVGRHRLLEIMTPIVS